MKNSIFLLVLFTLVYSACLSAQTPDSTQITTNGLSQEKTQELIEKKKIMEREQRRKEIDAERKKVNKKFDFDFFEKRREGDTCRFFFKGMEIEQVLERDPASGDVTGYYEYRVDYPSPYKYYRYYDAFGNIEESGLSFYSVLTGTGSQYDSSGNVIREEDYDAGYLFSIDMLIKKMEEEHAVDLLSFHKVENQDVIRYMEDKHLHIPVYEISSIMFRMKYLYLVDGNTGKTLYTTHVPFWTKEEDIPPIVEQYLEAAKKLALDSRNNEDMVIKRLDIKHFNKHKSGSGGDSEVVIDGLRITQNEVLIDPESKDVRLYYERRGYINSPYTYYSEYDTNGNIIKNTVSFYDIPVGVAKDYDSSGNVIKEENRDVGFPFSIEMLVEKMKKEHDIDLLKARDKWVSRTRKGESSVPEMSAYYLVCVDIPLSSDHDIYLIDGNTGETLYKMAGAKWADVYSDDEPRSIVEEYMNSLKEGKEATNSLSSGGENGIEPPQEDEDLPRI